MIGKREMQKITMTEKLIRNENEAIEAIKANMPTSGYQMLRESLDIAIKALEEIQQYRAIGTVEEVEQNARDLPKAYLKREDGYYRIIVKSELWKSAGKRWRSRSRRKLLGL